jgi:tRNA modification GTPase
MPKHETIVALGTPSGEAALAVIRVSGADSEALAKSIFGMEKPGEIQARQATVGIYHNHTGLMLDQCVFILYPDHRSFTGEPMLEINSHGNPFIVQKIIHDLVERGCRLAQPGEFSRTAVMNGKMDLSQAEAIVDIVRARSDKALEVAQKQLFGALGKAMDDLCEQLLQIIAEIEAYIDFPEEDLPTEDPKGPVARLSQMNRTIQALLATHQYSAILQEGIKTVIIGAPNAGKSSLLNTLLGHERAIVSPIAGTTRDFITERLVLGPYCLQIIDTAGLRKDCSEIEAMGIEKTRQKIQTADVLIYVIDGNATLPELETELKPLVHSENTLLVFNKSDLPATCDESIFDNSWSRCHLSLKTGEGVESFQKTLLQFLESKHKLPTEHDIVINTRHATVLTLSQKALTQAIEGLKASIPAELVATHLREALSHLGDVTGKNDNELVLDKLFASFCIGK